MNRIFISYRSSDGSKDADRLAQDLGEFYGDDQVFYDKHDLRGGSSWRTEIFKALAGKPVVLPIITPEFFDAKHADGHRRIDEAHDPVRQELEAALQAGVTVIPLLTEGVRMPSASLLPESLRDITERHALKLRTGDWPYDLQRLRADLNALGLAPRHAPQPLTPEPTPKPAPSTHSPWVGMLGAATALALLLLLGTTQADADADTYLGGAVMGLIPLGMAWLARRWAQREAKAWPGTVSSALVGVFSLQVLVMMVLYTQEDTPPAVATHPAQPYQAATPTEPATPTTPTPPVAQAVTTALDHQPPDEPPPTSAGHVDAAGTWHTVIDNDLQTTFALQHQNATVWMASNVFSHEGSPPMRMQAQGQIRGRQLELNLIMQTAQGQALDLPAGKLVLELSADGSTMAGTLQFAGDPPAQVHMTRQ